MSDENLMSDLADLILRNQDFEDSIADVRFHENGSVTIETFDGRTLHFPHDTDIQDLVDEVRKNDG